MTNLFNTILVKAAGISEEHPLAEVITGRDNLIELSEKSHDAALKPNQPGGLSHSERAALASRIARLNKEDILAQHYQNMIGSGDESSIANTDFDGASDARLKAILRHTDLVAGNPKDATSGDITALMSAGISEEDIVRLSELIAFVSYQIRVVVGLRLMGEVV